MSQTDQGQALQALLGNLSRYTIQNLTIKSYGPLTILSDKPSMHAGPQDAVAISQARSADSRDTVTPQWSWETAHIKLKNDLEGTLRRVTVRHQRGLNAGVVTAKTWENVNPGDTTDVFSTDFQEGLFSDYDYWQVEIQLEEGGPVFKNNGWKQCNMREDDVEGKGPNVFRVEAETFFINLRSGSETTSLREGSPGLNGFAWMQVQNKFSSSASDIELRHNHAGFPVRTKAWDSKLGQGQSTSSWPVYFTTGLGDISNDSWDISVLREGDKKPHVNYKKDKGCMLQGPDNGHVVRMVVRNDGWTMAFPSGACDDYWDWAPAAVPRRIEAVPRGSGMRRGASRTEDDEWTSEMY